MKEINKNKSFISGYTFKEGFKRPEGVFYNWKMKYIGYVQNYQASNNFTSKIHNRIWLLGYLPIKVKCLDRISLDEDNDDNNKNKNINNKLSKINRQEFIKVYLSCDYYDGALKDITIPFNFTPYKEQEQIMNDIEKMYFENPFKICRALIWGKPGGGKSFIGKLLAKKYRSAYSFDIKLLDPGTPILNLWRNVTPTKEKPLIIQIDEFDIIIKKIHSLSNKMEAEKPHQWMRTVVSDKQSYNTFLSEYIICLPYVIYLFTMNSSPDEINKLDKSYIRNNRIDMIISLDKEIEKKNI